jgi:hypothetical protein
MSPTQTRQTFREVLAQVAAQARTVLPQSVNGRLESAVKLVLAQDVVFHADGTATVGSASDPLKTYTLAGQACDCQDFAYGQAPEGWCQHRIAANLARSVERVLARTATPMQEPPVEPWADNDYPEDVPAPEPLPAPVAACALPEAPASVNVHLTIAGRQVQLTLRDTDETRLLARLQTVLAQYPAPAPPARQAAPQGTGKDYCHIHNVTMPLNTGKDGRTWYSHRLPEGGFCKGK